MAVNYSILADVEFETKNIAKNLQDAVNKSGAKAKIGIDVNGKQAVEDLNLSVQAANAVFRTAVDVIGQVTAQVYSLDDALTEFKKVSDLSGTSLDNYVDKLAGMGEQVARTGKPKRQAPNVGMVNQHLYLS